MIGVIGTGRDIVNHHRRLLLWVVTLLPNYVVGGGIESTMIIRHNFFRLSMHPTTQSYASLDVRVGSDHLSHQKYFLLFYAYEVYVIVRVVI